MSKLLNSDKADSYDMDPWQSEVCDDAGRFGRRKACRLLPRLRTV
jgi:hypothetical protein